MKTELSDRVLWYDGTSEVKAELVPELILHGVEPSQLVVKEITPDVELFNLLSEDEFISQSKNSNEALSMAWQIPESYQKIDLDKFILSKVSDPTYVARAKEELELIKATGLGTIFKTLIFVVDQLKEKKQIWGVGRGSSCASLVLHLIGVHEVDPVKYGIPASEFFHD